MTPIELFQKTLDEFIATFPQDELHKLSAPELRMLEEIMLGRVTKESAAKYNLANETVRQHRKNIYRKLGYKGGGGAMRLSADFLGFVLKKIAK